MRSVAAATAVAGLLAASDASAVTEVRASAGAGMAVCTTKYKVIGRVVAVRRPAWKDGSVARPDSPVDHYVHRGDVLVSCIDAIARTERGPAYRKCGRTGSVWRVVRGGQIPATCVRRI
ncbi:hypothetical protein ABT040_28925 [Streptomyces sp. NPDC002688]|uniref:hypothetical protein n=1 Tax=Streptomyces sp. NPDC002688 TaxID=3154423 RepID=UPI00331FDB97